jgi:hypothetical protein
MGVGAGQALHLGQQEAQMLGMHAQLALRDVAGAVRRSSVASASASFTMAVQLALQLHGRHACAVGLRRLLGRAGHPELLGVGQQVVERGLRAGCDSSVPSPRRTSQSREWRRW